MNRILLAASLSVAVLLPSAVRAQDARETIVRDLVTRAMPMFQERGFTQTGETTVGRLAGAADATLDVTLEGGKRYALAGMCDGSCSDLDLTLTDAAGRQVGADVEKDDAPLVVVSPATTATYHLKVSMIVCTSDPCRYAVATFVH